MSSLSGKQSHELDYSIKCELDNMPAPHASIQIIIMESPRFVLGLLLFLLFSVLGYAQQIVQFLSLCWEKSKPLIGLLLTLQKLLSIQWIFLCVLDYLNNVRPSTSPVANHLFLKNYLSDISALAISPQKIIELDENNSVEARNKRAQTRKSVLTQLFVLTL